MEQSEDIFDNAFQQSVELANRIANKDHEADLWDIADGVLAGAIQYWLYSRQPCGDPRCEDCEAVNTAESRMAELHRAIDEFAADSEYYHSPKDVNVGRA